MAIAVYGATGATGRQVAAELRRASVEHVLAGRDARRLAHLREELGDPAETRAISLDDPRGLRAVLKGCEVVLNCAGPFGSLAEPLLQAALDTGTHYADPAGEQSFIRMVYERYGALALRKGVALIPALGFDYALGDCAARVAAGEHEPLEEVIVAYAIEGAATSGDTLGAGAEPGADPEVVYRDGAWRPAPGGVHRASFRFPPPLGRQPVQRYGSGEVITVPRHTRTRAVTALITTSTWAPHPALAPAVPFLRPLARAARRTPLRAVLGALGGRARDDSRATANGTARFTIAAVAHSDRGPVGRALVQGRDFDALTAAALATGGAWLARGAHRGEGALPPAAAFDPVAFLDALADHGVRWERG